MKDYLKKDEWKITEDQFHPEFNKISESLCSLGNGKMGLRGNFAEGYSGETLQGSYYAGIYYPDKTKVGWWKNGYPEYFAKVLNGCNWIGLKIMIGEEQVDLNTCTVMDFNRSLDMKQGILTRDCTLKTSHGVELIIRSERFCSMHTDELGVLDFSLTVNGYTGPISISSFLDFDIANEDSNYDEKFWNEELVSEDTYIFNQASTKKTNFSLGLSAKTICKQDGITVERTNTQQRVKYISEEFKCQSSGTTHIHLTKFAAVGSSLYFEPKDIKKRSQDILVQAIQLGYDQVKEKHIEVWSNKWEESDIIISGDVGAQQGIRFNIFHLNQTYTGKDARLNIGPKGFTGEKYGGSTYWDTEAYCLPFYLSTAELEVSKNLLVYRHNHLAKAIENAEKLGFENGAALYPMVTINGEECHNEWEITFEEIHRNGAIAYAIYNYTNYSGDSSYLFDQGLDVLIGIARFWSQRVNFSEAKQKYVMLGVTGPNEYENNVNNNWYTNYIAKWCLQYTIDTLETLRKNDQKASSSIIDRNKLKEGELTHWKEVIRNIYLPEDKELGIFLQQDNFLDKDQTVVKDLDPKHLPLNQNWSWDRILRSVYIKQADVLQGLYFFEDHFDQETHRKNFDYYEPRTVHESSLSPCVHAILASRLGKVNKAYEMYLRTSRLDLDDYNNDTEDGLHITSMAGTWLAVIQGFGGMRVKNDLLVFNPSLPENWQDLRFRIKFREQLIKVLIKQNSIYLENSKGNNVSLLIADTKVNLQANANTEIKY